MKKPLPLFAKILKVYLLAALIIGIKTASAQDASSDFKKNDIQINLSSLALKNYNFSYERSIARKITVVAGYRFMPMSRIGDLSLVKKITNKLSDDDNSSSDYENISTSNKAITAEVRFYGGKHDGARGFYLSLYGRYTNVKADYPYVYSGENGDTPVPITSSTNGYGGGIMIGAKWLIAKRVTFDWYIIGAHYGSLSGDGNGPADLSNLSDDEKANLKSDLEGQFRLLGKNYVDATVTNQGVAAKIHGPFLGLRGLGFNIGVAF